MAALSQDHTYLTDQPITIIEPSKAWVSLGLKEVWRYRELLYFLIWRDVKVRYKQTVLGVTWVVLQPLFMTIIFTVFLGGLARVPTDGVPYPLLAYSGLLPWTFFSSSITTSATSLVGNSSLITKVYFPRLIAPMAAVAGRLIDFAIAFLVLGGMMFYYRVFPKNLLILPGIIILTALLTLSLSILISAMNVKYRDVGMALPALLQFWLFVSPVLYPASIVPGKYQFLYALNPMVGIIGGFRAALLGTHLDGVALAISAGFTAIALLASTYWFRHAEKYFADII